ncbi:MAG: hypothetical protein H0V56_10130 [Chthoniobacterales bacterium]|nr:hypothetical protein [Chthoniobacterales bacterium]
MGSSLCRLRFAAICAIALLHAGCGQDRPDLPNPSVDHTYHYGETISFARGGDSHRFRASGWSDPEPGGTWSDSTAASLAIRLPATEVPVRLLARLRGHVHPPGVPSQPVHVYVRGEKVALWDVAKMSVYSAVIPQELIGGGGVISLDFHIPGAVSPAALGTSSDHRRLGIECRELRVVKETNGRGYDLGTTIEFGAGKGAEQYQVSGWSHAEAEFTWTEDHVATLHFQLPQSQGPLLLRARLAGATHPPQVMIQPVEVLANGTTIAQWEVGDPADLEASIPADVITESLTIEFRTPNPLSPQTFGQSADSRVLGVCVFHLTLDTAP